MTHFVLSWITNVGCSIELSLDNVLLWTRRFTYGNEYLFFVVLQGSYGVVKLAYNEDDDKHYVSQRSLLSEMQSLHHTATKELYSVSAMLLIFIFQSHPLKLHHLPRKKQEWLLLLLKVHPRLYYLSSKQCCFVYQVAALRSVLSGECGYEPARWDEVILSVFIKVICSCESSANLAPLNASRFMFEHSWAALYSNNN